MSCIINISDFDTDMVQIRIYRYGIDRYGIGIVHTDMVSVRYDTNKDTI